MFVYLTIHYMKKLKIDSRYDYSVKKNKLIKNKSWSTNKLIGMSSSMTCIQKKKKNLPALWATLSLSLSLWRLYLAFSDSQWRPLFRWPSTPRRNSLPPPSADSLTSVASGLHSPPLSDRLIFSILSHSQQLPLVLHCFEFPCRKLNCSIIIIVWMPQLLIRFW